MLIKNNILTCSIRHNRGIKELKEINLSPVNLDVTFLFISPKPWSQVQLEYIKIGLDLGKVIANCLIYSESVQFCILFFFMLISTNNALTHE